MPNSQNTNPNPLTQNNKGEEKNEAPFVLIQHGIHDPRVVLAREENEQRQETVLYGLEVAFFEVSVCGNVFLVPIS